MSEKKTNTTDGKNTQSLLSRILTATEIDTRMLGMVAALFVIWAAFDIYSGLLRPSSEDPTFHRCSCGGLDVHVYLNQIKSKDMRT